MKKAVHPVARLSGNIVPPPDKSISHRSAMFAALSSEDSLIQNYSSAADPQSTLECLRQLGVKVHQNGSTVKVSGVGRDGFQEPDKPLDCGNSGTTMRLLSGIVAGAGVKCSMIGDESLSARTMKRIIDPLQKMGCKIDGKEGVYAPLEIDPHDGVKGMRYPLPIASAQLKSCVLLAGLFGEEPTEVIEDVLSRDHTERLLQLETEPYGSGKIIRSSWDHVIPPQNYSVPGDFSAAAFWLVAGSIHKNAEINLNGVGVNPSRDAVYHILEEMGASFKKTNNRLAGKEPVSDLYVESSDLQPINLNPALIPNCIDELPILMVAMCFAEGTSVITGAEELRHKETDRLSAMAEILNLAGADVELQKDGMIIHGKRDFKPASATYPTYHDHRMAMAAAVLATKGTDTSAITHADCTAISYPNFWNHLQTLSDSAI
ncbi:MAG: 3-phosphoshikimate 1-carboxyvinyltransferase [Balneolaceae bacterium]|nr:3-phosphoshikimate 1-carboxyvinyltransferase [Balneolaceae bacterium]